MITRASSWPLHALRLTTPTLALRAMDEASAEALAAVVPDDLDLDPRLAHLSAAADVLQAYALTVATFRTSDWVVPFVVLEEGAPVGLQALEAKDFAVRRTVDTHSWLVPSARGRGLGKVMRTAVLELAFTGLDAHEAITEAWSDNAASLGVSRTLGYVDNGTDTHAGPRTMQRMRLLRADWRPPVEVTITGLAGCRELLSGA